MTELTNLKVLIADDHAVTRHGLQQIIRSELTCLIKEAGDGSSALRLIQTFKPEICILDVNMPNQDGITVLREMRRQHLPGEVIFLTMYKDEALFSAAIKLGAKGYVLKDSALSEILESIRAVAAGHSYISPEFSDYLLSRSPSASASSKEVDGMARLSPTERRVLKLIGEDKTSKEIAQELGVSPRTVENHRAHICDKLNVHGIHSLVKFAFANRSPPPLS